MSEGPIKAHRDAWKPRKASTTDSERICATSETKGRGYCGRKMTSSKLTSDWAAVVCSDCEAARRADLQAAEKGK